MQAVRLVSGVAGKPGSRYERVTAVRGKRRTAIVELVERTPGVRLALQGHGHPFPVRATFAVVRQPGGSDLRLDLEGRPRGRFALLAPIVKDRFRRSARGTLERVRQILDARNGAP